MDHPQKRYIAKAVKHEMAIKGLSLRGLADKIGGVSHPQLHRVTSAENYNISTLLKVFDELGLEIEVKKK